VTLERATHCFGRCSMADDIGVAFGLARGEEMVVTGGPSVSGHGLSSMCNDAVGAEQSAG
jgi:hypothetical protein